MGVNKLSALQVKAAKPRDRAYKMADGGGLYLFVRPTGAKSWRYDYDFLEDGAVKAKRKTFVIGLFPDVSLQEAGEAHQEARRLRKQGIDPCVKRKTAREVTRQKVENSFEAVALEWFYKKESAWSDVHSKRVLRHIKADLIPQIGARPINAITPPELLAALRTIEGRGANETAHRVKSISGLVFRYAIATGRAERDPSQDLREALAPVQKKNFATITDPEEICLLLRSIDGYTGNLLVRFALKIAPYVFVRPSELRRAEWGEFDLVAKEWRIPAKRMKMRQVHKVPLAAQVVALLEELQKYTGRSIYLFPSMRTDTAPVSDMTLTNALRRMGYDGDTMTVHGFRGMASTLLNEQGYNRDWIERQLAHGERNNVRASYNHAEHLADRRRMMQEWADYLDSLRDQDPKRAYK